MSIPETYRNKDWPRRVARTVNKLERDVQGLSGGTGGNGLDMGNAPGPGNSTLDMGDAS